MSNEGITGEALVAAARRYMGVPWVHQGRNPAVGLDCLGLPWRALKDLGYEACNPATFERCNYRPKARDNMLEDALSHEARRVWASSGRLAESPLRPLAGDFLVFKSAARAWPNHLGLLAERGADGWSMIHATSEEGYGRCVTEHGMVGKWRQELWSVWRLGIFWN